MWGKVFILIFLLGLIEVDLLHGQASGSSNCSLTIPAIAILDIEPAGSPFTLTLTPPTEAGNPVTIGASGTNNSKWLNYTSAITAGDTSKSINVRVTSGIVPAGITLSVQAGAYSGNGAGVMGLSAGSVNVDNIAKTVISGIGGCYTGNGSNAGHKLTYSIAINDYALLNYSKSTTLQLTYTITD